MASLLEGFLGKKIGTTRIVPLVTKIVLAFSIFVLVSNFTTSYINLTLNRTEIIKLTKELLVKDLKETYTYATNQFEIYQFSNDLPKSMTNIEKSAAMYLKNSKAISLGVKADGTVLFQASKLPRVSRFPDAEALKALDTSTGAAAEGSLNFALNGSRYFGVYKYNAKWDMYILRAEELNELYANSRAIFARVSVIIVAITILTALVGIFLIRHILRYVGLITSAIMKMQEDTTLTIIDLKKAPNDEVTFLGASFNSLSSTINNLVTIFRKFVSKDLAIKAYQEKEIRLEGKRTELTILFSDIRSFTTMTETLGTDVIKLLNIHYEKAISAVIDNDGIIGSLIGDAVLAVYGTFPESRAKKSLQAIQSAYAIQENAKVLRKRMTDRREEILRSRGEFSDLEERIYRAVLLEVGVGLDGGEVFYGNIGSHERMTNTVIGDNVNAASRLEGLTRIYNVPVICSEFVKSDIEEHFVDHGLTFMPIDTVLVKGKLTGKKIYWPMLEENLTPALTKDIEIFSEALRLYYLGDWTGAHREFSSCSLPPAAIFKERTRGTKPPAEWNGIWEMKTK